jgi:hypothetical protein
LNPSNQALAAHANEQAQKGKEKIGLLRAKLAKVRFSIFHSMPEKK